ncbi:hypothetical protein HY546_03790, partial [archaeon]|nr:hypothetical protein [archaeon]
MDRALGAPLLLILAILVAGCTGYLAKSGPTFYFGNASLNTSINQTNLTVKAGFIDLCSNVICGPSRVKCPDGFIAECSNTCIAESGECTQCRPGCAGHLTRSCASVSCAEINYTCPDGFIAECQQACYKGFCVSCTPDCSGHFAENESNQT